MYVISRPARAARRWIHARRSAVLDAIVAVVTTIVELSLTFDDSTPVRPHLVVLVACTGVLLLARRRATLTVLPAVCAVEALLAATGGNPGGAPALVALFTVAELRDRRVSVAALVPTALFLMVADISSFPVTVGAWALGTYAQTRRRYTAALEERAAHLEREHEQLSIIAAQRERAAIARELHDIIAHSVTVTLVGVRGARDVLRTAPDVADDTLERVETNAEQSLVELRRMLLLLREPDQGVRMRPQPSLAQLPTLVASYGEAGLPARLEITGTSRPLAGGVELSVYRIVEEALTNVLKHARPTHVAVTLDFGRTHLHVAVVNDGEQAPEPSSGGHGIIGMRERIGVLGGELEAQPGPDGGFRVAARLPLGDPT
ncbi:sensor histidine kinase [Embleya scabrispora]|uniref:sensor histidine kinase n=1 Tax=Embleya scabrispora TaxID=159449 RepID=UPI000369780C|nr:histidine kinase [Embleya scabrispora]MYS79851.1 two-component sensor histidine kinase [Streptomyces sp. SID5474]